MELFQPWHIILLLLVATPILAIHFLPVIIAGIRRVTNFWWIFTINVLFGWTIIGWIVALVWSLRDRPAQELLLQNSRTSLE